ncbi:MAG: amidohydrolase family protein [Alistipes sp.]|nr:amidohydrolase family protein [Alistipes sp.]
MRRIAAHHLISRGEVIARPLVECDSEGRIMSVEQWQRLDNIPHVEFYSGVLCPGFVNAHCHLELSYLRGAIEQGTGFGGFARAIGMVRGQYTMQQRQQALAAADAQMWAEGVQAVADIINDDSSLEHKQRSNIRYRNFAELFGLNTPADSMNHLLGHPATTLTPHSTYSLQSATFASASEADTLSLHFMESPDEEALYRGEGSLAAWYERMGWECDFLHYGSPARRVIGQLTPDKRLLLVHGCCMTQHDIELLHRHFTHKPTFVVYPQSNRYISALRPCIELLIKGNCHVAIGTDSLASNHNLSILEELKLLPELPLATALEWATWGGATALGMEAEIGSIEIGKRPGVVLIEGVEQCDGELRLLPTARSRRLI